MKNYICNYCGAFLDPGEICDCLEDEFMTIAKWDKLIAQDIDRQLSQRKSLTNESDNIKIK